MKRVLSLSRLSYQTPQIISCVCNCLPQRSIKYLQKTKRDWVRPTIPPIHDPKRSGDLQTLPQIDETSIRIDFQDSEELKTASEEVKNVFSLKYQTPKHKLLFYEKQLVDKVKSHEFDNASPEVKIAKMTARIHFLQAVLKAEPRNRLNKHHLTLLIDKRMKKLKELRSVDYKKFEWLLEKLDILYKPCTPEALQVSRRKSLVLFTRYEVEKENEKKLGALKQAYDEQKVPFLEKKLDKYKWIQQMEKEHNLDPTVTEKDIQELTERIEKVKIEVAERQKQGYVRSIHPYYLEPYDENILREKERALREKKTLENQKAKQSN